MKKSPSAGVSGDAAQLKQAKKLADVDTKKVTENKQTKNLTHEIKKTTGTIVDSTKDVKQHIVTSTPRKDAPKPAPPKVDASAKNGSASARAKKIEEPVKKVTQKPASATVVASGSGKPLAKKTSGKPSDAGKKSATSDTIVTVDSGAASAKDCIPMPDGNVSVVGGETPLSSELPKDSMDVNEIEQTTGVMNGCHGDDIVAVTDDKVKVDDAQVDIVAAGVEATEAEAVFNPGQDWGIPQNLPAPADKEDVDSKASATGAAGAGKKTTAAVGEKTKTAAVPSAGAKRSTIADRLNQTVVSGRVSANSESSRGAAAKSGRLSLQSKELKPMSTSAVKTLEPLTSRSEQTGKLSSASSHLAPTKKLSPSTKPITPVYVDLTYVPAHATDQYNVEFFQRVRARHYVVPGTTTDPRVLALLADAKLMWDGEVNIIPTGDAGALISWFEGHRDQLTELKISMMPSVSRSSLELSQGSSCQASRVEF
jgi:hypothetical protein